jgi:nicotinamide mononucleotide transporter
MLEAVAVIASFICVILTINKGIAAWAVGIVGIVAYFFLFHQEKLYAEMGLQVIFLAQSIYGWYHWSKNKDKSGKVRVLNITRIETILSILTLTLGTMLLYHILTTFTDASIPSLDALTATISLTANILLARRKIEAWYLWMFVDIIFVGLFIMKGLYLSAILYGIFFLFALKGLLEWGNNLKKG